MANNNIRGNYKKARANYLARVRRLQKSGFDITPIKLVKNPTKASIDRLNKQTTKAMREKSKLYDAKGNLVTEHRLKISREIYKTNVSRETLKKPKSHNVSRETSTPKSIVLPTFESIAIENWWVAINNVFAPSIRDVLKALTEKLTDTPEKERAFARVLKEHPELFPEQGYESATILRARFSVIAKAMQYKDIAYETAELDKRIDDYNFTRAIQENVFYD